MQRVQEPEWLDGLPPEDPRAIRSRRDLRILNALMGNVSYIAASLRARPQPRRVMDIGAGDGRLSLALARKLEWRNVHFVLVDRVPTISDQTQASFASYGCQATVRVADILAGVNDSVDVVFANLFLHHFTADQIRRLLAGIAESCSVFVACEPRRSRASLVASHCVGLLGCNAVTRHDAVVSVRAGFADSELSGLWPASEGRWTLQEGAVGAFTHRFTAARL